MTCKYCYFIRTRERSVLSLCRIHHIFKCSVKQQFYSVRTGASCNAAAGSCRSLWSFLSAALGLHVRHPYRTAAGEASWEDLLKKDLQQNYLPHHRVIFLDSPQDLFLEPFLWDHVSFLSLTPLTISFLIVFPVALGSKNSVTSVWVCRAGILQSWHHCGEEVENLGVELSPRRRKGRRYLIGFNI